MPEHPPLTKEERERIIAAVRNKGPHDAYTWFDRDLLRYEETVKERERRIAALEAEVDALESRLACAEEDAAFCNAKRNETEAKIARLRELAEASRDFAEKRQRYLDTLGTNDHAGKTEAYALWSEATDALCYAALRVAKGE